MQVERAINKLIEQFDTHPHIFLTEDDVRSHLFIHLMEQFTQLERTQDGQHSYAVHSEVRWYGEGNLKCRSDVVVIDVRTLKVKHYNKMPSKGFGFNIPKAIIEIKLRRPNGPTNRVFSESLRLDVEKLESLKRVFSRAPDSSVEYWLVALDKKSPVQLANMGSPGIKFVYRFKNEE